MIRLIATQSNEGLPFVNSDFNGILQNEHLKSYSSLLDGMNDVPLTLNDTMNRGLLFKGVVVLDYNSTTNETSLDLKNSIVYIPGLTQSGDFYEPHPDLLQTETYTISSETFYLYVDSATFSARQFYSGTVSNVTVQKFFTINTSLPESQTYTPHIQFSKGKTTRKLDRIMKWNLAEIGEIFITGNVNYDIQTNNPIIDFQQSITDFDITTGLGEGDMFGFALCDGQNGRIDLKGRMIITYDFDETTVPTDNTSDPYGTTYDSTGTLNYGTIGNKGGGLKESGKIIPSHLLKITQIPNHNHNGQTSKPNNDLYHTHFWEQGNRSTFQNEYPPRGFNKSFGGVYSLKIENLTNYPGQGVGQGLRYHKHSIKNEGQNQPHETRPPYLVLAYYQKINPY